MLNRNMNIVATLLVVASPATAQERTRPITIELQAVVQHATAVAAHAGHIAASVVPVALASVEPALAAIEPTLLAVEPMLSSAIASGVQLALADLEHITIDIDLFDDDFDAVAPEPWADQDPADSLYRAARRALNDEDYSRAAQLFSRIHDEARFRNSEYRPISFYYEAFARHRMGGRAELQRARTALDQMRSQHADAWRDQGDAAALLARINADLARLGDADAAKVLQERGAAAARGNCKDANMGVRIEALNALLQMDAASAMPILEEIMKKRGDECSAELRRKAVFLVSQKKTERTADLLLDAAKNDPDPEVQEQAVFWLSQVGGEKSVDALESILKTSHSRKVQERAIFSLSQHRSQRAGELLKDFAMRSDVPDELRGNAIFWIGQHRGADNARFLQEIYPRLDSREIKEKVIFSMSQLKGDASADWLLARALDQNEHVELRKNALFWAGQHRAIPIAKLNELYDRMPSTEMKRQLVFVLSQRARDPEAVEMLIRIAQTDKDPELRKNAIFWLGQSKDPRAAKFLLDLIKN